MFEKSSAWLRKGVLVWASFWMLLVPLVHMHPDMTHDHGAGEHVHSGIIHAVFSQDPDEVFDGHQGHDQSSEVVNGVTLGVGPPHEGQESAELGLSILRDSSDRKSFKPLLSQDALSTVGTIAVLDARCWAEHYGTAIVFSTLVYLDRPSRAPPTSVV